MVVSPVRRTCLLLFGLLGTHLPLSAQDNRPLSFPPDSIHWSLEGRASVSSFQGKTCLMLDGGNAIVNDFALRDGIIDMDVATMTAPRGFIGIQFRVDSLNGEYVYLRPHKSGLWDAMQYTPILNTGLNWQLYSGPGFSGPVDIPKDTWFHMRLAITGAQAQLYVKDMNTPALVMTDLKTGMQRGQIGLAVLIGATCFANFEVRPTPDVPWVRHFPEMPLGAITQWSLSPSFDVQQRKLDQPLSPAEAASMSWEKVVAEPPGLVPINRYRLSPHPRVTFQSDFSTRLNPQPGTAVVYARTTIASDREQTRKLFLGYSDEVTVYLNGKTLYRGRSAQSFRDPAFLGIVSADDDMIYLPLKKGNNDLVLAVSELGGGWGFVGRLADLEK